MKSKTLRILALAALLVVVLAVPALADKPVSVDGAGNETAWNSTGCATIQSGTITDAVGNSLEVGYDKYGYNYQAHLFNGFYGNYSRPAVPVTSGDRLVMKWSDEWLANVDCNGDHKLDRGLVNGVVGGISKGWVTNHMEGEYSDAFGVMHHYTYFVKIVWVGPGGPLWGQYEVVEEIYNDPAGGFHGVQVLTDPGLGHLAGE